MKKNIAIVGATGAVGTCMRAILEERDFPIGELRLLASARSAGKELEFKGEKIKVQELTDKSFKGIDIALFSAGAARSAEFAPHAVKAGAIVIDNTSHFRMDKDVPLVVPEVNPTDIEKHKGIIANPNCSTIQMVVALKPLHDFSRIKRVVVSTYQAVSGAGQAAVTELKQQTSDIAQGKDVTIDKFPYQIAFNLIPQIDVPVEGMYTKEELKMVEETKKIMGDVNLKVTATCVRVPVFSAHSESVNIEMRGKITREEAIGLLKAAKGVCVVDDLENNKYPLPLEAQGKDLTYVGRIREDNTVECGLNLWVVSDNLRKGAALNAIQIAEYLLT